MHVTENIAVVAFERHFAEAANYLDAYGKDPGIRHQGITQWYYETSRKAPHIAWFSAMTIGSARTSAMLAVTKDAKNQNAQTLYRGLSEGGETVFKHFFALYQTYLELGTPGLKALSQSGHRSIEKNIVQAFEHLDSIHSYTGKAVLKDLRGYWYLKYTDKFSQYQMEAGTAKTLKEISKSLTAYEQSLLQKMYERPYVKDGPTVAEVFKDPEWALELEDALASQFPFQVTPYHHGDIGDVHNRMAFFKEVWDRYFEDATKKGGLAEHEAARDKVVALLETEFIEPKVIYQYKLNPFTANPQWEGVCESIGVSQTVFDAIMERENNTVASLAKTMFQLELPQDTLEVFLTENLENLAETEMHISTEEIALPVEVAVYPTEFLDIYSPSAQEIFTGL